MQDFVHQQYHMHYLRLPAAVPMSGNVPSLSGLDPWLEVELFRVLGFRV